MQLSCLDVDDLVVNVAVQGSPLHGACKDPCAHCMACCMIAPREQAFHHAWMLQVSQHVGQVEAPCILLATESRVLASGLGSWACTTRLCMGGIVLSCSSVLAGATNEVSHSMLEAAKY